MERSFTVNHPKSTLRGKRCPASKARGAYRTRKCHPLGESASVRARSDPHDDAGSKSKMTRSSAQPDRNSGPMSKRAAMRAWSLAVRTSSLDSSQVRRLMCWTSKWTRRLAAEPSTWSISNTPRYLQAPFTVGDHFAHEALGHRFAWVSGGDASSEWYARTTLWLRSSIRRRAPELAHVLTSLRGTCPKLRSTG